MQPLKGGHYLISKYPQKRLTPQFPFLSCVFWLKSGQSCPIAFSYHDVLPHHRPRSDGLNVLALWAKQTSILWKFITAGICYIKQKLTSTTSLHWGVYNSLSNQSLMFQHSDAFQYLPSTDSDAENELGLYSLSAWKVSGGSLLLRNCQVNGERETQFGTVLSSTFQKHLWHFILFSAVQECVHLPNLDRSSLASAVNLTSLGRTSTEG